MILETERLTIRPLVEADIEPYAEIVADPQVMHLITGEAESYEEASTYVQECMQSEREFGYSRYAVLLRDADELIGFCGFKHIDGVLDFGWRYAHRYWGQGYGTEAAEAVLEHGLRTLKLPVLFAAAFPENVGSVRIMQKIGMRPDSFADWEGRKVVRYIARNEA